MPIRLIVAYALPGFRFLYFISYTLRFKKKIVLKFVFWILLQKLSKTFLNLRRTDRVMIKNVLDPYVNYALFLSDLNTSWIFSTHFLTDGWYVAGFFFVKVMQNSSLRRTVTGDETWDHHFAPIWKRSSMERNYCGSSSKIELWSGKISWQKVGHRHFGIHRSRSWCFSCNMDERLTPRSTEPRGKVC